MVPTFHFFPSTNGQAWAPVESDHRRLGTAQTENQRNVVGGTSDEPQLQKLKTPDGLGCRDDGGPAPLRLRANGRTVAEHHSARQRRDTRSTAAVWLPRQRLFAAHATDRGIRPAGDAPLR